MRIIYIHRKDFHKRPPVISAIQYLSELGYHPHVITTGISNVYSERFKTNGVGLTVIPFDYSNSLVKNTLNGYLWGIKARKEINRLAKESEILLWIEGNYTFTSLGADFINKYPHVLQNQELFDLPTRKGRIVMNTLKKIMPTAVACFAPEYNRAYVYTALLKLKDVPVVLPNKPAFLPSKENLKEIGGRYVDIVQKINGRRVILYQGSLARERNLDSFIKACSLLDNKEYVTVLLGKTTEALSDYKKYNPNLIHVEYIPAPDYLYITSLAYIGIVTYSPDKLNTIYCAPNKIFEYSAFGVPMIGNDIPGLRYTIDDAGCGIVCNDRSVDDIKKKLDQVISNYQVMSEKATKFFNSVDNKATIRDVVEKVKAKLNKQII